MKRLYVILAVFLITLPVFAEETKLFSFSFTPEYGIMNGTVNEYVFEDACLNTNHKESELDWDVKNIQYIGFSADMSIIKYIYCGLGTRFNVTSKSGNMQDYDWMNSVNGWDGDATENTHYSIHDNTLNSYINFNFYLGGNINLPFKTVISPFIGYEYELYSFDGTDGKGKYKTITGLFEEIVFNGKVISYSQELNSFFIGVNAVSSIVPHLNIRANFKLSPTTNEIKATDRHYIKNKTSGTVYMDIPDYILILEGKLYLAYSFNQYHGLGLNGSIQYIPVSKGHTYQRGIDNDGKYTTNRWTMSTGCEGGVSRFVWAAGIHYTFTF